MKTVKEKELKPCPFCGQEARIAQSTFGDYFVECRNCAARTRTVLCAQGSPKNIRRKLAIDAWNQRHNNERRDA
jgi:Lar family restriction alleviation protein